MDDLKDIKLDGFNEEVEEENIIEITDDDGNVTYFAEEMVIPVNGKNFAILVEVPIDEDEVVEEGDENVIIARIDFDEKGEPLYVGPTEEEFEEVKAAYETMTADWDDEE
mgnify:FL=1